MSNRRSSGAPAIAVVCALAWLGADAQAQDLPRGPLSLEQALALAEGRSERVTIARAGIDRADGEQARARSGRYPQVSANAAYDRALASEFEGIFDNADFGGGDAGGGEGGEGSGFEDLPFGRENTWRLSVTASQTLYSGGRLGAQADLARIGRDTAALQLDTTRARLLYEVTQAYYDAALSDRLVAIAEASLALADQTLTTAQAGFTAGTQPEFEVLRARVARGNQVPQLIRERVNRELALMRLKQLLELPQDYVLELADTLGSDRLPPPPAFAPRLVEVEQRLASINAAAGPLVVGSDVLPGDRTAVREASATVRLREAALTLVEAERLPSVTLSSTYSRIAYPTGVLPTFDRTNWSVGASLTVPILTGGRQRADEAVARAELTQAQAQLRQVEDLAGLDTRAAWAELLAALAAWEATAGTVQQASRAYEIAEVRYGAGVSTQLELSDSRLLLQQAEANRAQAARDLQVARARVALLPDLPLDAAGGAAPRAAPALPAVPAAPVAPGNGQFRNASAQAGQAPMGTR